MKVHIQSVNSDEDDGHFLGKGRKTWVESKNLEIHASTTHFLIKAECGISHGTGERGGVSRMIKRRLVMNLDEKDLREILEAALKATLVTLPGVQSLIESKKHLDQALAEMGALTRT